jgi:hypothetical protein
MNNLLPRHPTELIWVNVFDIELLREPPLPIALPIGFKPLLLFNICIKAIELLAFWQKMLRNVASRVRARKGLAKPIFFR